MVQKEVQSIVDSQKHKSFIEQIMKYVFFICSLAAAIAVFAITLYMIISGSPAIFKIGLKEMLFSPVWAPTATSPSFGILYIILTSIIGTFFSVLLGVPIGIFTAIFLSEVAPKKLYNIVKPTIELLAGIPSIVYGLFGVFLINPLMYKLELIVFKDSLTHQFTGGSNLLAAILVLAIMILPMVINVSEMALKAVPLGLKQASLALGATYMQTIFKVCLPVAKSGIITAIVLGVGRAIGEAMAIVMVSGNSVNLPLPFNSVRFLTTGIVSEMAYSSGLHREALFTIGLILFVFIMFINIFITRIIKKGAIK